MMAQMLFGVSVAAGLPTPDFTYAVDANGTSNNDIRWEAFTGGYLRTTRNGAGVGTAYAYYNTMGGVVGDYDVRFTYLQDPAKYGVKNGTGAEGAWQSCSSNKNAGFDHSVHWCYYGEEALLRVEVRHRATNTITLNVICRLAVNEPTHGTVSLPAFTATIASVDGAARYVGFCRHVTLASAIRKIQGSTSTTTSGVGTWLTGTTFTEQYMIRVSLIGLTGSGTYSSSGANAYDTWYVMDGSNDYWNINATGLASSCSATMRVEIAVRNRPDLILATRDYSISVT